MLTTRSDRIAVALLVALVAAWVSPFFVTVLVPGLHPGATRFVVRPTPDFADFDTDAQNHYTHIVLPRLALLRYGQFPWRTHLLGGGLYSLAHPRDVTLSPVVLPVLVLGEVWGLKVQAAAVFFVGALGMYYLCRACLGFGALGSFYAGAMLVVASWLPSRLYIGCYDEWHFMLFPLILAFFTRARADRRYGIAAAMLLYVVLYDGKYVLPISFLFLALFGAGEAAAYLWRRERLWWEPAVRLAAVAALVVLLAAVKVVPMLSILAVDDRTRADLYAQPFVAWDWLMLPGQVGGYFWRAVMRLPAASVSVNWVGLGPVASVVALAGLARHPRRLAGWGLLIVVAVWLSLWRGIPLDLFKLLWHLPLFRSIKGPPRYFNWFLLFGLCVTGGCLVNTVAGGLQPLAWLAGPRLPLSPPGRGEGEGRGRSLAQPVYPHPALSLKGRGGGNRPGRRRWWRTLAALVLTAAALERPLRYNALIQQDVFRQDAQRLPAEPRFYPVVATHPHRKQMRQWRDYLHIRRNVGVINWYCPLDLPRAAVPRYFVAADGARTANPDYRGEAWCLEPGHSAEVTELTPNRIRVAVAIDTADTLVINQNHDGRWRTDAGTLTSVRMDTPAHLLVGLDDRWASPVKYDRTRREFRHLAVRLDRPGKYTVTLRYRPWDGYVGAGVSAAAWGVCVAVLVFRRRRVHTRGRVCHTGIV